VVAPGPRMHRLDARREVERVVELLPAALFGDDPAGFGGDVTAALHGDAAA